MVTVRRASERRWSEEARPARAAHGEDASLAGASTGWGAGRAVALLGCLVLAAIPVRVAVGEERAGETAPADGPARIRDNLFLLEEAYNQEPGVIQHIQVFQLGTDSRAWTWTFTEEWPVPDDLNQFSVTLPVVGPSGLDNAGLGDVLLNWRFQAVGAGGKGHVAIAPRVSLVTPSGDPSKGTGRGAFGVQLNLPVSVEAGPWLVLHANGGTTIVVDAESPGGARTDTAVDANAGLAIVGQPLPWLNPLVEVSYVSAAEVGDTGTSRGHELIVNPGVRFAIDHRASGLQVVPGIGVPMRAWPADEFEVFVLACLSLEHPAF